MIDSGETGLRCAFLFAARSSLCAAYFFISNIAASTGAFTSMLFSFELIESCLTGLISIVR